jgi:Holliday junction resolvasome RuvABC ATP-dependent DNA helicase subunit
MDRFHVNHIPIIIIDEYDRVEDQECRVLITDVIKGLTLCKRNPTLVLVGVAENIIQLVYDHKSIAGRNLVQLHMKRMNSDEVKQVITSRLQSLGMQITDDALWRIALFSAGLPAHAHSLGKFSALSAIANQRKRLTRTSSLEQSMLVWPM